jgi:hypothetical protein
MLAWMHGFGDEDFLLAAGEHVIPIDGDALSSRYGMRLTAKLRPLRALGEHHRPLRRLHRCLVDVVLVVQSDRDDLARAQRR